MAAILGVLMAEVLLEEVGMEEEERVAVVMAGEGMTAEVLKTRRAMTMLTTTTTRRMMMAM